MIAPLLESRSAVFLQVLKQLRLFARHADVAVLLEGESGTGKTTIGRYLHQVSPRSKGPYQHVVLSTLDDGLASSELFGHVAGAFTDARSNRVGHFASAAGGTLFLDEIGKASRPVQQKLLHAIEYGEIRPVGVDRHSRIDVRIVAATNVPLAELVGRDQFLPDLEARLSLFRVRLPALRERRADIPLLIEHYLAQHAPSCGYAHGPPAVDDELLAALAAAPWPHNLRQLDATIHRLLIDAEGAGVIGFEQCCADLAYLRGGGDGARSSSAALTRDGIERAIDAAGSVAGAARRLGVHRATLYRMMGGQGC